MKKSVLFIYPAMVIGGSTTALLSLMNSMDPEKYEIDLQLFRNEGPLLDVIPDHVNLLPAAELHKGISGKLIKLCKLCLSSYAYRFLWRKCSRHYADAVQIEFQARANSRKSAKTYDYAISFLEHWSNWYLAYRIDAKKKYAWIHSTFSNTTGDPDSELPWMKKVDKIIFVTKTCQQEFVAILPQMAEKAVAIENIMDSRIILNRSLQTPDHDQAYRIFADSKAFRIVTVCRLTIPVKGLDRIVRAASQLKAEGYEFLWYIVGDGEDEEKLKNMISKADVADCLVPIGKRMNPYPFVAAADIMCMPSRHEGKPIAVTESMVLGTPPVVTAYLAAHEQIKNGEEGIIVENADDSIVTCVRDCINDRKILDDMRTVLRSREYGNSSYVNQIEQLLFFD